VSGCGTAAVRLPDWFRQPVPDHAAMERMRGLVNGARLNTVCREARCPNIGECWSRGTATFMLLGETCTRACRFCAVHTGRPGAVMADEPMNVAESVRHLGLKYVVITSVTRDDLPDGGASHFAATVRAVRSLAPQCGIELLIPDFSGNGDSLGMVAAANPQVIGHNLETVRRLSLSVRSGSRHERSLGVLKYLRSLGGGMLVKSGFMAGMGETDAEVLLTLQELKDAGCDIVTIGQYLAPSREARHAPVARFVEPSMFDHYRQEGLRLGIRYIASGALVRSSYLAEQGYAGCTGKQDA
jgi:lipoic acid synthetase